MISVHIAHVNKRKANGIFWFLKNDPSESILSPRLFQFSQILNVLKFVNAVWNNFRKIFLLLNVMHWSIFVTAFPYSHGKLLVTASINIVYRVRFGLVLLSAVANCGSSNLWETCEREWAGGGWKKGGQTDDRS